MNGNPILTQFVASGVSQVNIPDVSLRSIFFFFGTKLIKLGFFFGTKLIKLAK
jgi:hypothetical protein